MYARAVFFVADAPRALEFYTRTLGFARDWTYEEQQQPYVCQVSLMGLELILNRTEAGTRERAGHGRVFIGLDARQSLAFREHVDRMRIPLIHTHWGAPTLVICDLDQNELFFWLPEAERARIDEAASAAAPAGGMP